MRDMKVRWTRLSNRLDLVEMLRKLPEGAQIPNFKNAKTHLFLRVEGEGEKSNLVLLTESGLGNAYNEPLIEFYPLNEIDVYIEDDEIRLPSSLKYKPEKIDPLFLPDSERYHQLLDQFIE